MGPQTGVWRRAQQLCLHFWGLRSVVYVESAPGSQDPDSYFGSFGKLRGAEVNSPVMGSTPILKWGKNLPSPLPGRAVQMIRGSRFLLRQTDSDSMATWTVQQVTATKSHSYPRHIHTCISQLLCLTGTWLPPMKTRAEPPPACTTHFQF